MAYCFLAALLRATCFIAGCWKSSGGSVNRTRFSSFRAVLEASHSVRWSFLCVPAALFRIQAHESSDEEGLGGSLSTDLVESPF